MSAVMRTSGYGSELSLPSMTRHWNVTKARLERTSPVIYDPAALKGVATPNGIQITGTVITLDGTQVVLDCTPGMVHVHNIRNVLTYDTGAEATFETVKEGTPVYYDRSGTMPANVFLSMSPLDSAGVRNPLFGFVVLGKGETASDFPKGAGTASSVGAAVMQVGFTSYAG